MGRSLAAPALLALLLATPAAAASPDASFQGLGDLPGGPFYSRAHDVSSDGSVVVGHSKSTFSETLAFGAQGEPVVWRNGVATPLGALATFPDLEGFTGGAALSGDGTTAFFGGWESLYRWTAAGGMENIPPLAVDSRPRAASRDGSVLVYQADVGIPFPFAWSSADGITALSPEGGEPEHVFGVSANGRIYVGFGFALLPDEQPFTGAVRWDDGVQSELESTNPGVNLRSAVATDITPDGSVIVGTQLSPDVLRSFRVFRWENGTASLLPAIGPVPRVAGSGHVILAGDGLYDPANGERALVDVMTGYGLDLTGWTDLVGNSISDDGRTIVGNATNPDGNPEGFVAVLPPACSDGLDNDGDGAVDHPADPGCMHPFGREAPQCDDGRDNDGDGRADWDGAGLGPADPNCSGPTDNLEATGCGGGFAAALVLPALAIARRTRRRSDRSSLP